MGAMIRKCPAIIPMMVMGISETNNNTKMKTFEPEFNTALKSINPEWSVKMGPRYGNYTIYTGTDEDGYPVKAYGDDIIRANFEEIADLSLEDNMGGFSNRTYRISDRLVVTIDDNANHFWLTEKSDDEIIAELKASYDA